jgi:hypothetical protein
MVLNGYLYIHSNNIYERMIYVYIGIIYIYIYI